MRTCVLAGFLFILPLFSGCNGSDGPAPPEPRASLFPPLFDPEGSFGPPVFPLAEPAPVPFELHFSLRGTDFTGAVFPVAGEVWIGQYDAQTEQLVAEFVGVTDAAGNVEVSVADVRASDRYEVQVIADDEWYFAPDSVAFFYGRNMTGEALKTAFAQPIALSFRVNDDGTAYLEPAGTVADFPGQFPDREAGDAVFEAYVSSSSRPDLLYTGVCGYYYEDFYLFEASVSEVLDQYILEVFDERPDCSANYRGKYLLAVDRERAEAPGFGSGLGWDSMIFMDPADEDEEEVFLFASSRRYYIGEVLYEN